MTQFLSFSILNRHLPPFQFSFSEIHILKAQFNLHKISKKPPGTVISIPLPISSKLEAPNLKIPDEKKKKPKMQLKFLVLLWLDCGNWALKVKDKFYIQTSTLISRGLKLFCNIHADFCFWIKTHGGVKCLMNHFRIISYVILNGIRMTNFKTHSRLPLTRTLPISFSYSHEENIWPTAAQYNIKVSLSS